MENKAYVSAVIVAGGSGTRMGSAISKQFIHVLGKPILAHTTEVFEACAAIDEIILVVPMESIQYCTNDILDKYKYTKVKHIIAGGIDRQSSVYNGLKKCNEKAEVILIHDGVRPFVSGEQIEKLIEATMVHGCSCLGVKVKDTIKHCDNNQTILNTLDRSFLWAAQTPQCFKSELIIKAHEKAITNNITATDDAALVEHFSSELDNTKIKMIEGSYSNIKITTKEDLLFSEILMKVPLGG